MLNFPEIEVNECCRCPPVLFLHVGLSGLFSDGDLIDDIINFVQVSFRPKLLLIPTFTYSFTKTSIFDLAHTPSEVGSFSEQVRKRMGPQCRSSDPIFSVVMIGDRKVIGVCPMKEIFSEGDLLERTHLSGHVCLNINTGKPIISTYLHYLEKVARVNYRIEKQFLGYVVEESLVTKVVYNSYVRRIKGSGVWDREKIAFFLRSVGCMEEFILGNIRLNWFYSKDAAKVLLPKILDDNNFLLKG